MRIAFEIVTNRNGALEEIFGANAVEGTSIQSGDLQLVLVEKEEADGLGLGEVAMVAVDFAKDVGGELSLAVIGGFLYDTIKDRVKLLKGVKTKNPYQPTREGTFEAIKGEVESDDSSG